MRMIENGAAGEEDGTAVDLFEWESESGESKEVQKRKAERAEPLKRIVVCAH